MKTVRLHDNIVAEIIPEYALPVENWYGASFAAQCMEAPDEVAYGWVYIPETGEFLDPATVTPEPTTEERIAALEAQIAETDETAIYLFEAQAAQDDINASQDEALMTLFEMIGGEE